MSGSARSNAASGYDVGSVVCGVQLGLCTQECTVNHIPREENSRADALSNEAIDSPEQGLDVGGLPLDMSEVCAEVVAMVDRANAP